MPGTRADEHQNPARYDGLRARFRVEGTCRVAPPGTYAVETEEILLDSVSFVFWRRVSTTITLRQIRPGAVIQTLTVEPQGLAAAQAADAAACGR
jgi:hypothetical protein